MPSQYYIYAITTEQKIRIFDIECNVKPWWKYYFASYRSNNKIKKFLYEEWLTFEKQYT